MQDSYNNTPQNNHPDYHNADGLLCCGVCHEPKEAVVSLNDLHIPSRKVPILCACDKNQLNKEEKERSQRKHLYLVDRLRSECFPDKAMYSWTFENTDMNTAQAKKCLSFVKNWEKAKTNNMGLLLWGDVGSGKSYMAGCIANALLENEVSVCMTKIIDVLNMSFQDKYEHINQICSKELLILDDFGTERESEYGMEIIYEIIDRRYISRKPLIVTTNLPLSTLQNPTDQEHERIYSRLLTMTVPVRFFNLGYRSQQRAEKRKIAEAIFTSEGGSQ